MAIDSTALDSRALDGNRYNQSNGGDPLYPFGEFLMEGDVGFLRRYANGRLTRQSLGGAECESVCFQEQRPQVLAEISARTSSGPSRRIVDLTLPIHAAMRGVTIEPTKTLARNGWNTSTLTLYSHSGTHMDAPLHYLEGAAGIDRTSLATCCGPAKLLDLTPVAPGELLTVTRLNAWADQICPGDRLLLRTDWHRRVGTDAYRDRLPRISAELARWLVDKRISLLGVEPPSVADVNNPAELIEIHRILLQGNIVVVEGLGYLDQLRGTQFELIVLPLRIVEGDGSPARAIAIETVLP